MVASQGERGMLWQSQSVASHSKQNILSQGTHSKGLSQEHSGTKRWTRGRWQREERRRKNKFENHPLSDVIKVFGPEKPIWGFAVENEQCTHIFQKRNRFSFVEFEEISGGTVHWGWRKLFGFGNSKIEKYRKFR